ncbi:Cation-transporting ATPase 1, partial [Operophtera brumata]
MKPESRQPDFRINKFNGLQGNVQTVSRHDSHDYCGNFATTNDLVYNHLPKPLCGPDRRYYKRSAHQFYPQPDLMKYYLSTLYDDSYVPPQPHQYLQPCARKARNSSFTKGFRFLMTKPKNPKK